jgi:hypothetical protein
MRLALLGVAALLACGGGSVERWGEVRDSYRLGSDGLVECDGARKVLHPDPGGQVCVWYCAELDGEPVDEVAIVFLSAPYCTVCVGGVVSECPSLGGDWWVEGEVVKSTGNCG